MLSLVKRIDGPIQETRYEDFELVQTYLYTIAEKFEKTLSIFLNSRNSLIRRSVFIWLIERF